MNSTTGGSGFGGGFGAAGAPRYSSLPRLDEFGLLTNGEPCGSQMLDGGHSHAHSHGSHGTSSHSHGTHSHGTHSHGTASHGSHGTSSHSHGSHGGHSHGHGGMSQSMGGLSREVSGGDMLDDFTGEVRGFLFFCEDVLCWK